MRGSCWPIVIALHLTTYLREQGWRAPESSMSPDPWRIPTALGRVNGYLSQGFPSKHLATPSPVHLYTQSRETGQGGQRGRPKNVAGC